MPIRVMDAITQVRRILQDQDPENTRADDVAIRNAMRMALSEMRSLRPDAFSGALYQEPNVDGSEIELEFIFFTPLVNFTTAYILMENTEFSRDGTSSNMLALARWQMTGDTPRAGRR